MDRQREKSAKERNKSERKTVEEEEDRERKRGTTTEKRQRKRQKRAILRQRCASEIFSTSAGKSGGVVADVADYKFF